MLFYVYHVTCIASLKYLELNPRQPSWWGHSQDRELRSTWLVRQLFWSVKDLWRWFLLGIHSVWSCSYQVPTLICLGDTWNFFLGSWAWILAVSGQHTILDHPPQRNKTIMAISEPWNGAGVFLDCLAQGCATLPSKKLGTTSMKGFARVTFLHKAFFSKWFAACQIGAGAHWDPNLCSHCFRNFAFAPSVVASSLCSACSTPFDYSITRFQGAG